MIRIRSCRAALITIASFVSAAYAVDPVFLASQGTTLYRAHSGAVQTYATGIEMLSMFYDAPIDGVLVGTRGTPGSAPLYRLDNALAGIPTFQTFAILERFYGTLTRIGDLHYGFHEGDLYSIDLRQPAQPVETLIGSTGLTTSGGSAFDPIAGVFYLFARENDSLYRVNWLTAELTRIGAAADDLGGTGLEWWDGQLFVAAQNFASGDFEIGRLNTADAAYQPLRSLGAPALPQSTSLAIVPEPAGCLAALSIIAIGRRRGLA